MKSASILFASTLVGLAITGCSVQAGPTDSNGAAVTAPPRKPRADRTQPALAGTIVRQCAQIVEEGDEESAVRARVQFSAGELTVTVTSGDGPATGDRATFDAQYFPTKDIVTETVNGKSVKKPWYRYNTAAASHGYDYNQVKVHPYLFDANNDGKIQDKDGNDDITLKLVLDAGDRSDGIDMICGKAERIFTL